MFVMAAILSLLIAVAGWHYLVHSTAANKLVIVEDEKVNQRRIRLRRVGGFFLLALAATLYIGFHQLDKDDFDQHDAVMAFTWLAVAVLMLCVVVVLALLDIRLTARLRKHLKPRDVRP